MRYFKIVQDETVITAEAHENPVFVKYQPKNGIKVRCSEIHAQGIISLNEEEVYQLPDKTVLQGAEKTAIEIAMTEYEEIIAGLPDEDLDVDVPDDNPAGEDHVMTAAEMRAAILMLTESVTELQERNSFLEDCLLEMSEEVYA